MRSVLTILAALILFAISALVAHAAVIAFGNVDVLRRSEFAQVAHPAATSRTFTLDRAGRIGLVLLSFARTTFRTGVRNCRSGRRGLLSLLLQGFQGNLCFSLDELKDHFADDVCRRLRVNSSTASSPHERRDVRVMNDGARCVGRVLTLRNVLGRTSGRALRAAVTRTSSESLVRGAKLIAMVQISTQVGG